MEPVHVVVPYSDEYTPSEMLADARETVKSQSLDTEFIMVSEGDSPAAARNIGLEQADSRYVSFLDADDLWEPDKLERQIAKMEKTGAGLCVEGIPSLTTDSLIHGLLLGDLESLTSSIVVDTTQVSARFNERIDRFEDHLFMIEAAIEADACAVPDLIEVRKHDDGLSAAGSLRQLYESRLAVVDQLTGEPEADPYLTRYRQLAYYAYGRGLQLDGRHRASIPWLLRALRVGIRKRPLGALALSPLLMVQDFVQS